MNENGSKSPKMKGIIKNKDKPVVQNKQMDQNESLK